MFENLKLIRVQVVGSTKLWKTYISSKDYLLLICYFVFKGLEIFRIKSFVIDGDSTYPPTGLCGVSVSKT